jgi:hypothetical protein
MRIREIEFDSVSGPDASIGNARKLQGRIRVEEVNPGANHGTVSKVPQSGLYHSKPVQFGGGGRMRAQ